MRSVIIPGRSQEITGVLNMFETERDGNTCNKLA